MAEVALPYYEATQCNAARLDRYRTRVESALALFCRLVYNILFYHLPIIALKKCPEIFRVISALDIRIP